jgi:5-methylcytosine-specific restriction protein A
MPLDIPTYRPAWVPTGQERDLAYRRMRQDREQQLFYLSRTWKQLREIHLTNYPYCFECLSRGLYVPATIVHHKQELRQNPDGALDERNLMSLCKPCHSRLHAGKKGG